MLLQGHCYLDKTMKTHSAGAAVEGKGVKTREMMPSGSHEGQAAQNAEAPRTQHQLVFDYTSALAALNGQNLGSLHPLSCEGESGLQCHKL